MWAHQLAEVGLAAPRWGAQEHVSARATRRQNKGCGRTVLGGIAGGRRLPDDAAEPAEDAAEPAEEVEPAFFRGMAVGAGGSAAPASAGTPPRVVILPLTSSSFLLIAARTFSLVLGDAQASASSAAPSV